VVVLLKVCPFNVVHRWDVDRIHCMLWPPIAEMEATAEKEAVLQYLLETVHM